MAHKGRIGFLRRGARILLKTLACAQINLMRSRLGQGGAIMMWEKKVRRNVWVVHRERVRDRLGLKTHGRLGTCVDTSFNHSTHYPVQVGCPDRSEYDAEDGDKVGDEENVGTA